MRFWIGLAAMLASVPGLAQESLTVGFAPFPPNVMEADGQLTGFDVELWEEIAREAELEYDYRTMPFNELLDAVRAGEVDAALAGITITAGREQDLDFSYSYMDSGLRVLTRLDQKASTWRVLQTALASGAAVALLYLFGFIFVSANVLWLVERGGGAVSDRYIPGVLEAAWCMVATMTTVGYGDIAPRKWLGRFVAFTVMIVGIGLFGVLVAEMSAGLTMEEMRSSIRGPEDLAGKTVATVAGSTSVEAAALLRARTIEEEDVDAAVDALLDRRVQAVIFDGPPLLYWLSNNPGEAVALLPQTLGQEAYGVAFPADSELREPVNRALLTLREDGRYDRLHEKWFGSQ